eukprot:TRINITY_DN5141_c0_g2_i1.p1 TRINITY_DN5141_c0_g2~~TRINITY_DN5141_c0_g2_i1.p1  ORF type:complete len:157 (-),score=19.29 TRINITY_DN5141_c0_g2_i1:62-532(-)
MTNNTTQEEEPPNNRRSSNVYSDSSDKENIFTQPKISLSNFVDNKDKIENDNQKYRHQGSRSTESLLIRVQRRSEQLCGLFGLPKNESLVDEFHCALAKSLLLQGRLYVFERYVCFYANIFGIVKKKAICMSDIHEITKRRHYGFPNSIEIIPRLD